MTGKTFAPRPGKPGPFYRPLAGLIALALTLCLAGCREGGAGPAQPTIGNEVNLNTFLKLTPPATAGPNGPAVVPPPMPPARMGLRVTAVVAQEPPAYDVETRIFLSGRPAGAGSPAAFRESPDYPNLRPVPRTADDQGRLFLRGLLAPSWAAAGVTDLRSLERAENLPPIIVTLGGEGPSRLALGPRDVPAAAAPAGGPESGPESGFGRGELVDLGLSLLGLPGLARDGTPAARAGRGQTPGELDPAENLKRSALARGNALLGQGLERLGSYFGRARVGLSFTSEAKLEGQAILTVPILDRERTALFLQTGLTAARSDRVLAHLGLAQRFLMAGNGLFGYNLFLDQDVLRGHLRGGLGLEAWKGWLRLAANAYAPLSGWKRSPDHALALEKPAWGYDAKLKAYLPFYPKLALETGFERWPGKGSGAFAPEPLRAQTRGEFSWGLSWSPTPLATVRLSQAPGNDLRDEIRADFTLNFVLGHKPGDGPAGENAGPFPTPYDSRFDPVERDYDMPLRYKARVKYVFKLLGRVSGNVFRFLVEDPFGRPVPGLPVKVVSLNPGVAVIDPGTGDPRESFVTSPDGTFGAEYRPSPGETSVKTVLSSGGESGEFDLSLEGGGPQPAQPAHRTVTVHYLGETEPNVHLFQARFDDDDSPAPNLRVAVSTKHGVPVLDPQSGHGSKTFVTDQGGYFRVKLGHKPGVAEEIVTLTPEGSGDSVHPIPVAHALTLSASRQSLGYLSDKEVVFSLSLDGEPLPAGTEAALDAAPGLLHGLPKSATTSPGGKITAPALKALAPSGPIAVKAASLGLTSNPVSFGVDLDGQGLALSASQSSLTYLSPKAVTFTVRYLGEPLPAGTQVSVSFDAGEVAGLSATVTLGAGGTFTAAALKALVATGPIGVSVGAMGLTYNEVAFGVDYNQAGLSLSASRNSLEYLNPVSVDFTVKYLGQPLPAGTSVNVTFEAGKVTGLSGLVTLGAGGTFNAPALKALVATGPIGVSVGAMGLTSNEVSFGVDYNQAGLSLSASRGTLEYLNPVSVDFTVKYLGQPLPAGTSVSVTFEAGEIAGLSGVVTLGAGGVFNAPALKALVATGPIGVAVGAMGLTSNEVAFGVGYNQAGLSLSASRGTLEYLNPVSVDFTVKYLGQPLPAGTSVSVSFDAGEIVGLSGLVTLGAGGVFNAPALKALVATGPIGVAVGAMGLTSNEVAFGVDYNQAGLSLSASRNSLEYLNPVSVDFTVKYLGQPLPAGTPVTVTFDAGEVTGLSATVTLGAGGTFNAPALKALVATGPIGVSVGALGL
ncbi:MAG: inverse autotransporter beta domain-containing protein, partial [Deltaproteobacteria bacterium]|nr:inverse autotransporter beta domain-containing protein [Deltaproteobacteria bacterium]